MLKTAHLYQPPSSPDKYAIFASRSVGAAGIADGGEDEELFVDGRSAVWRTLLARVVRKRFSFGTPILQAIWCTFADEAERPEDESLCILTEPESISVCTGAGAVFETPTSMAGPGGPGLKKWAPSPFFYLNIFL